ncbi:kinase-regulated stress-responsive transcription factor skn7 [Vanrija albida]|uniref:Kinase-regulated stress-responsive transcription factor skn7 n=1 Tax=Vanrija albida TaxID=181172 RepID=A0ABR3QF62_9TREE
MSRVPSSAAPLPPIYFATQGYPSGGVPGQVPMQPPPGYPVATAGYSAYGRAPSGGLPPPQGYPPDSGYNALAGSSRDQYSTYTMPRSVDAGSRVPSGGGGWASEYPGQQGGKKLEDEQGRRVSVGGSGGAPSMSMGAGYDAKAGAPGASSTDGGTAGSGGASGQQGGSGQQPGPSEFIKKLYKMLEDESETYGRGKPAGAPRSKGERGSVGWGRGGTSFVVWDMNEFTTKVLPQTFRHSNFSSFVRQLNKYGFSKIKHVDEETGQIKENVWEFQHPSFQAGGKADLDSIKRKAVVPKKTTENSDPSSPGGPHLSHQEAGRVAEMESRIVGLEDMLFKTTEQLRESRHQTVGMMTVLREVLVHLAAADKEEASSSPSANPQSSARIQRLLQLHEQVTGSPVLTHPHPAFPINTAPPAFGAPPFAGGLPPPPPPPLDFGVPFPGNGQGSTTSPSRVHVAPTHGANAAAAAAALGPQQRRNTLDGGDDVIELPSQSQTLFNGEPLSMTPSFADGGNGQWNVDTSPNGSVYNRKPGEGGASLRLMVDSFVPGGGGQPQQSGMINDDSDATAPAGTAGATVGVTATVIAAAANGDSDANGNANGAGANGTQQATTNGTRGVTRRNNSGTTIKPSWSQAPKILVVEDDVVYRQLSSKFLEKFGCVVETVENAQQGVELMNKTKYDLVLMDIFFGPNMDGRKATSLIRQFDTYTPIISMTSNVQTKDVDSYLKSGMNDVLAKPFTKLGLFGILDKHLFHLKAIQLSTEVPRFGVPPLSDQGIADAVAAGAAQWQDGTQDIENLGSNPLAGTGLSDDQYALVLQSWIQNGGAMPDIGQISVGLGPGTPGFGASVVFPDGAFGLHGRKRSIDAVDDIEDGKRPLPVAAGTITEMA